MKMKIIQHRTLSVLCTYHNIVGFNSSHDTVEPFVFLSSSKVRVNAAHKIFHRMNLGYVFTQNENQYKWKIIYIAYGMQCDFAVCAANENRYILYGYGKIVAYFQIFMCIDESPQYVAVWLGYFEIYYYFYGV